MSAQQAPQYPIGNYLPEYNSPLPTQRRSFDALPAHEVRAAQYAATMARSSHYLRNQHSSNFNQPRFPYTHHAPPAPLAVGHHHHHSSSTPSSLPAESWYSSPAAFGTPALEPAQQHHPSPLLPHSFHPHLTLVDTRYHPLLPNHDSPHMDLENFHSLFTSHPDQLPPTSLPVSPTHSNPASISPSISPPEYPSRALAEYPISLASAHGDSPRQRLLTSLRNSPPSSHPTAPHPTHHRTHHSLTSILGGSTDDNMTFSTPTAHQHNLKPQLTSIPGIPPTNATNRSRAAHHGSSANLYSPYSPSRVSSSSSPSLDAPRPHVCGVCQAAFHRNHDLKRHKDVHNDTKPFVCQCGRAFTRKDALKRHMFLKSCGKDKGHESA